jgi:hypothetical protein
MLLLGPLARADVRHVRQVVHLRGEREPVQGRGPGPPGEHGPKAGRPDRPLTAQRARVYGRGTRGPSGGPRRHLRQPPVHGAGAHPPVPERQGQVHHHDTPATGGSPGGSQDPRQLRVHDQHRGQR